MSRDSLSVDLDLFTQTFCHRIVVVVEWLFAFLKEFHHKHLKNLKSLQQDLSNSDITISYLLTPIPRKNDLFNFGKVLSQWYTIIYKQQQKKSFKKSKFIYLFFNVLFMKM